MLATTVDVTSFDADEATQTVSDWIQQAGAAALIGLAALIVLNLVIGIAIAKKAGYSGWWGAFAVLVPVLGWLLILLFAMLKWPSLKERDEALSLLAERGIPLPSHEKAAMKQEERMRELEAQARRDMERAQAEREKAEAERARLRQIADDDAASRPTAGGATAAASTASAPERHEASGATAGAQPSATDSDAGTTSASGTPSDSETTREDTERA